MKLTVVINPDDWENLSTSQRQYVGNHADVVTFEKEQTRGEMRLIFNDSFYDIDNTNENASQTHTVRF